MTLLILSVDEVNFLPLLEDLRVLVHKQGTPISFLSINFFSVLPLILPIVMDSLFLTSQRLKAVAKDSQLLALVLGPSQFLQLEVQDNGFCGERDLERVLGDIQSHNVLLERFILQTHFEEVEQDQSQLPFSKGQQEELGLRVLSQNLLFFSVFEGKFVDENVQHQTVDEDSSGGNQYQGLLLFQI